MGVDIGVALICALISFTHIKLRQTWGLSKTYWKKLIGNEVGGMCHWAIMLTKFEDICLLAY